MRFQFDPDEATCLAGNQSTYLGLLVLSPPIFAQPLLNHNIQPASSARSCPVSLSDFSTPQLSTMADQVSEALEVPREFVKDGVQFSMWPPVAPQMVPTCPGGLC